MARKKATPVENITVDQIDADIDAAMAEMLAEVEQAPHVDLTDEEINAIELDEAKAAAYAEQETTIVPNEAADEASGQASDQAAGNDEDPDGEEPVSFAELIASVQPSEHTEMAQRMEAAFAARAFYEVEKDPLNANIQKTLTKARKAHMTTNIVNAFIAAEVDPEYVNATETANKRRNVYALDKLRDILYAAVTGHMKNAINIACTRSLFRLEAAKEPFTGLVALCCASDKVAAPVHLRTMLTRHTVAESTASTQSSSTMTALEVLGVVKNVGTRPHPIYELVDTPLTRRLREIATPAVVTA